MVERTVSRTQELRLKFTSRYAYEIALFQQVLPQWTEEGSRLPKTPEFVQSEGIVLSLLESNPRLYGIVFRLAIPLWQRLDWAEEYEKKHPPSPTNDKQTLLAILALDEQLRGIYLDMEFSLLQQSAEGNIKGKVYVSSATRERIDKLHLRRQWLFNLLPEEKRPKEML